MKSFIKTPSYFDVLTLLKTEIKNARLRAHLSVNRELIMLYWRIGSTILERQEHLGWGSKVIEQLSFDLKHEFPDMKGFSVQNLWYMRQFAFEYKDNKILQQLVGEIPWGHNITLMTKVKDPIVRQWYIQQTREQGWSRNMLTLQINSNLYERYGKAITNFKQTMSEQTLSEQTLLNDASDLAQQLFKSEYNFQFLGLEPQAQERQIERSLMAHVRDFLLELGTGFAFIGNQYKVIVGNDEFFIDMLFFHTQLRRYIVLELKTGSFLPEYIGKLGFYLTAIDRQLKLPDDNPTIGLLLCQSANQVVVEYSLSDTSQPMGVSKYQIAKQELPAHMKDLLPTPEQFRHLFKAIEDDEALF